MTAPIRGFEATFAAGSSAMVTTQNIGDPVYRATVDRPPFPAPYPVSMLATTFVLGLTGTFQQYFLVEQALPGLIWRLPPQPNPNLFKTATRLTEQISATPVKSIVFVTDKPHTFLPQVHARILLNPIVIRHGVTHTELIG